MGKRILLDVSPAGIRNYVDVDEHGFTSIEHTPSFVENEILDECARIRALRQNTKGAFRLAAKVPLNTHAGWKKEWREKYKDVWTWQTFLAMKLNSRDYENLRVGHQRSAKGMKL